MKTKLLISVLAATILAACSTMQAEKKCCPAKKDIALQLYSLRADVKKDGALPTIKDVAKMGYTAIEAAGYKDGKFYGMAPEEFKKAVEANGIKVISSHTRVTLSKDEIKSGDFSKSLAWWKTTIDAHKRAGIKYVVDPYQKFPDEKTLKAYAKFFNQVGKMAKDAGLKFGYHNHAHEFEKVGKEVIFDYLINNTAPELVFFEMDVYWVVRGKNSPVEYFKKYPNRFKLLHIKDHKELGESGMVGFDAIFKNLPKSVEGIVVEVERYNFEPKVSVKKSFDYLNKSCFVPASYAK